jgi:hypothetical protein
VASSAAGLAFGYRQSGRRQPAVVKVALAESVYSAAWATVISAGSSAAGCSFTTFSAVCSAKPYAQFTSDGLVITLRRSS